MNELLELPIQLQIVLVVGYIGYKVASVGSAAKHKTLDALLQILVFGVLATSIGGYLGENLDLPSPRFIIPLLNLFIVLFVAAIWRRFGNLTVAYCLRTFGITRENLYPSTWESITNRPKPLWSNVSVRTVDGEYLESYLVDLPDGLPNKQIDVDEFGNVALYLTRRIAKDGEVETLDPVDSNYTHITYIPSSRIDRITISRLNEVSVVAANLDETAPMVD